MAHVSLIVLVFGFVFAVLASRGIGSPPWQLGWAALACLLLATILGAAGPLFGIR